MTNAIEHESPTQATPRMLEAVTTVTGPDGRNWLCGVAKRTYVIARGNLAVADRQQPLAFEPRWDADEQGALLRLHDDVDVTAPKSATDVVVSGPVVLRAPARRHRLAIAAGKSGRTLELCGPRHASVDVRGRVSFAEPEPFSELVLGLENAYGGHDRFAQLASDGGRPWFSLAPRAVQQRPGLFAYPRNPLGIGWFLDIERRRADGAALPRIEDPDDALTPSRFFVPDLRRWIDAPVPGHLGWVPYHVYPRSKRLAPPAVVHDLPQRPISEARFADAGDLASTAADVQRGLQGAAPGLAADRLHAGSPLRLTGFFADLPDLALELPRERPEMRLAVPDLGAHGVDAALETVRIDLGRREIAVTWLAKLRVACRVPDHELSRCSLEVAWRASI